MAATVGGVENRDDVRQADGGVPGRAVTVLPVTVSCPVTSTRTSRVATRAGATPWLRFMLGVMICAICYHLATGSQEARDAVTVVAGYAACAPHFAIAEVVGKVYDGIGLAALDNEGTANCGQCGHLLGSDLGSLPEGPDDQPLCIACASR